MDKPTESETKELWEWCGRKNVIFVDGLCMHDNSKGHRTWLHLDLNNLFKYAVPKVIAILMGRWNTSERMAYEMLFEKWLAKGFDALALFWVLYPVLKEERNEQ